MRLFQMADAFRAPNFQRVAKKEETAGQLVYLTIYYTDKINSSM